MPGDNETAPPRREGRYWVNLGAVVVLGATWLVLVFEKLRSTTYLPDLGAYYEASRDLGTLYDVPWHHAFSYVYSPAFAQAFAPLTLVPFPVLYFAWTGLYVAIIAALVGPVWAAVLLVAWAPAQGAVTGANVDLFIVLAAVFGFRRPGLWAFALLTKVTPGIGILWFAVRREWASLVRVLAVTGVIVVASFAVAPQAWVDWVARLASSPDTPPGVGVFVTIPLGMAPRLVLAAGFVAWGALTNGPWTVVVAAFIASPNPSSGRTMMLLGVVPLLGYGPLALREVGRRRFGVPDAPLEVGGATPVPHTPPAALQHARSVIAGDRAVKAG